MARETNRKNGKKPTKVSKRKKQKKSKKPKKKATWKKGSKMASAEVRLWRRKMYYQWPDLSEEEKQTVRDQHDINELSRNKQIRRMQRNRRLKLGWNYIVAERGGYKILSEELAESIEFYKANRSKYDNWGGWDASFGTALSNHLIEKFNSNDKWCYWSKKAGKGGRKLINSLLRWLDERIRKHLEIEPESNATQFSWNSVMFAFVLVYSRFCVV